MIVFGRRAAPWLVGLAVLLLRGPFTELASPDRCPALLESMSMAAVRAWPDLTIGGLFRVLHSSIIVVGLAVFVELLRSSTGSLAAAVAIGVSAGLSPMFATKLAPPWEAAAFAALAAAVLLAFGLRDRPSERAAALTVATISLLVVFVLLAPAWMVLAAPAAAILMARTARSTASRWLAGSSTLAAITGLVFLVLRAARPAGFVASTSWPLSACVLPQPAMQVADIAGTIRWFLGPLGLALGVLGAFTSVERVGIRRSIQGAALGLIALILFAGSAAGSPAVLMPWLVALWWLAAVGTSEILRAAGSGTRGWIASGIVVLLLPALQAARVAGEERDDWASPLGHEQVTFGQMTAMLNVADSDGRFVAEDATVDVLLRAAAAGRRRTVRNVIIIPPDPEAIRPVMSAGPIYAFPRGQESLSFRGFVIEPKTAIAFRGANLQERVAGLAAITGTRPCLVVGDTWADVRETSSSGRLAIAADSETAYGPVALYIGIREPTQPQPDRWPLRTMRGFRFTVFDLRSDARRARLLQEAREMGLVDHRVLSSPAVVSFLLHRTPRAPRQLAVILGAPILSGAARLAEGAVQSGRLTVCDAPPLDIQPFGSRTD